MKQDARTKLKESKDRINKLLKAHSNESLWMLLSIIEAIEELQAEVDNHEHATEMRVGGE